MHFNLHVLTTNHTRKINDTNASILGPVAVIKNHGRSIITAKQSLLPDLPSQTDELPASVLQ